MKYITRQSAADMTSAKEACDNVQTGFIPMIIIIVLAITGVISLAFWQVLQAQ